MNSLHQPVLLKEVIEHLLMDHDGVYVDVTAGYGGHASQIYQRLSSVGQLICIDRDPAATHYLREQLPKWQHLWCSQYSGKPPKAAIINAKFSEVPGELERNQVGQVTGILADLGVSSPQLDQGHRGFAFLCDGPLDMRMNPQDPMTAAEVIAEASEDELRKIFYEYGQEPKARYIAKAIVERRKTQPIIRTTDLAELIQQTVYYPSRSRRHPATRVFQALRIHINDEIGELKSLLEASLDLLRVGGRCGVISFHSLEDRPVKKHFKALSTPPVMDQHYFQVVDPPPSPDAAIIKPFPIYPSSEEQKSNPRSRSAKLRIYEKGGGLTGGSRNNEVERGTL